MVASIAMAVGVWGSRTWAEGSFATVYLVTALVAVAGGFAVVPPLLRWLAPRANSRSSTESTTRP